METTLIRITTKDGAAMLLTKTFFRRSFILIPLGVVLFLSGQSGAFAGVQDLGADTRGACLLCHSPEASGIYNHWSDSPLGQAGVNCVMRRLDFFERSLVTNLVAIGYPLTRKDVGSLEKTMMRFNGENRIDLIEKILRDREGIHKREDIDYFIKTKVILDALRLLDEHDLPVANKQIDAFNRQEGWEKGEKALLAYMAAKRNIRYSSNTAYLLNVLSGYRTDSAGIYSEESFQSIIDERNGLSYLADLFASKGDRDILNWLINYSLKTYGFPAENLSHMFVEMLLRRPKVFISTVAIRDDHTVNAMMKALIFGIRNNPERQKVKGVLQKDLFPMDQGNLQRIYLVINTFYTQIDLASGRMRK